MIRRYSLLLGLSVFLVGITTGCSWLIKQPPNESVIWQEDFSTFNSNQYYLDDNGCASWDSQQRYFVLTNLKHDCRTRFYLNRLVRINKFDAEFDLRIGGGSGADGMTFAFVRDVHYPTKDYWGGHLDFHEADGYAVEFDTYYNSDRDPTSKNHIAILHNSIFNHIAFTELSELDDNQFHRVHIKFDNGLIQIFFDNMLKLDFLIPNFTPFDGYFGFTAGTGDSTDFHIIDNINITALQ